MFNQDSKSLEAGAFVRPIHEYYVPKHVTEKYPHFDAEKESYCYTRYGILVIPNHMIREI